MQTGLRGRDLISLQEWTLEEVETVLEVAADAQARQGARAAAPIPRGQGPGHALLLLEHAHPSVVRGRHGPARRPCPVHREPHHADRPRRHCQGDRRDPGPLQRRDRHPSRHLGRGQPLHPRGRGGQPGPRAEHAVRHVPSPPDPRRPADHAREEGRPAAAHDQRQLGLRGELPEADERAPGPDPGGHARRA